MGTPEERREAPPARLARARAGVDVDRVAVELVVGKRFKADQAWRVAAATGELAEAHAALDGLGVPRNSGGGSPYTLPDRVEQLGARERAAREQIERIIDRAIEAIGLLTEVGLTWLSESLSGARLGDCPPMPAHPTAQPDSPDTEAGQGSAGNVGGA